MRRTEHWIIALTACALLAALGLGWFALRLARHEAEFRIGELRGLLQEEARIFAERCRVELGLEMRMLAEIAATVSPEPEAVSARLRREACAADFFITDSQGALLWPGAGSAWSRDHEALFSELVSSRGGDWTAASNQLPFSPSSASRLRANQRAQAVGQVMELPPSALPVMATRFAVAVHGRNAGCVAWTGRNRFTPLVWSRNRDRIVGIEVEPLMAIMLLLPLFPETLPDYFRIELTDPHQKLIYAAGYMPPEGTKTGTETVAVMPLDEEFMPGYQIRAAVVPSLLPLASFRGATLLQLGALLVVIVAAGGLAVGLVRRELRQAAAKSSFVASVSHELKTPLTGIRIYSEMLRDFGGRLPEERKRHSLEVIVQECDRLGRLIENVLNFSRLEAGRRKYNREQLALQGVLADLRDTWEAVFAESRLAVTWSLPAQPVYAFFDRDSLVQVMNNLFGNAVKYAAGGERLEVRLEAGPAPVIRVRDFGPGIPARAAKRVFRPFYRLDRRLNASAVGSGLGLSIARQMLRDQGGDLRLTRHPDGAEFTAILPGAPS